MILRSSLDSRQSIIRSNFDKLLEFYSQYPIDYIIMGQHFVLNEEEHIYSGELHHEEDMMMRYVDQVIEGLETGCFTYLAHPDLLNFGGSKENYEKAAISCVLRQQRIRCRLKLTAWYERASPLS